MKKSLSILSLCCLSGVLPCAAQNNHASMADTVKLSEVTVSAERPMVQRKADRMIVSVEHSKLLKSRSLSNILNLIPGVNYDGEAGITIMGNGVRIYENGRMVKLSGAQLKRYLSSLRGNDIKSLELLPQATAEYDAEGGTGVLVINRQKKHDYGLSGYVGSDYERKSRNAFSEFTGLTYSWGNFSLYGNMTLGQSSSRMKITESDFGQKLTVISNSEDALKGRYYMPKLGFDFYISPKQYIGAEWSGNYSKDYSNADWIHSTINDNRPFKTLIDSYAPYSRKPKTNNVTFNYEWKIDSLGSKLNVVADYVGEKEHDLYEYENRYTLSTGQDSIISKSQPSTERIDIYSAQADFAKCFKHQQLTLGAKYVNVGTDYLNQIFLGNTGLDGKLAEDIDQRDDFHYAERRYAIYGTYRYSSQPWDVQVGLRNEYTEWESQQRVKAQLHNKRKENNLFPSFFARKTMGEGNSLSLSYTQSINRPTYQAINPYIFHLSETAYKEGNPDLKGELLYNAALQYVLKSKYVFYFSTLFIDRKFNEVYDQVGDRLTRYTLKNEGNYKRLMLYVEVPFTWGIWNSRNNTSLTESFYKSSIGSVNDFGLNLNSFNRFRLSKQFTAMANLRYIRHYKQLHFIQKTDYVGVDLEGDYSCLKDKLSINFGVKDLLNSRGKNKLIYKNGDFEHHTNFNFTSRKFFISATFSFSAGTKQASQRNKTYSNEEEKGRM